MSSYNPAILSFEQTTSITLTKTETVALEAQFQGDAGMNYLIMWSTQIQSPQSIVLFRVLFNGVEIQATTSRTGNQNWIDLSSFKDVYCTNQDTATNTNTLRLVASTTSGSPNCLIQNSRAFLLLTGMGQNEPVAPPSDASQDPTPVEPETTTNTESTTTPTSTESPTTTQPTATTTTESTTTSTPTEPPTGPVTKTTS